MATHKLTTPMRIGDLKSGITVDKLELVSFAVNFQPILDTPKGQPAHIKFWRNRVIIHCVLRHPTSDWQHSVTLAETSQTGEEAAAMWDKIKAKFPDFEKEILAMLAEHLPPGEIND